MQSIQFQDVETVCVGHTPDPQIEDPQDVIIKVELAGLCGSDLHLFHGRETGADVGTVMGHEFVGTIVETGTSVNRFAVGDRVCAPFTTNCGECFYCNIGLTSRCLRGQLFGWRQQQRGLHGGQAEFVRVALADGTLMEVPAGVSDELALLLGDNLSTGFFCAEMAGIQPEGTCVVIGCGTVGLISVFAARQLGAQNVVAVDPLPQRLRLATSLGASHVCQPAEADKTIRELTGHRGADSVMELVGLPQAQKLGFDLIRPGGTMSVIGCHCSENFEFSPAQAYDKNLIYKTGRCPARHYMDKLSANLNGEFKQLESLISHRFPIEQGVQAYDIFARRKDGCQKAVIEFDHTR